MKEPALFPISISFEMTDSVASAAAREAWLAVGRRLFTRGTLVLMAAVALIFALAVQRQAPVWWLLLTGTAPVLFALVVIGWGGALFWAPIAMRRRLAHLPHRQVTVEFNASQLAFQTATERLEVAWSEVKVVRPLPRFWLLCLKGGAEIPLPREVVSDQALAGLRAAAPAAFSRA